VKARRCHQQSVSSVAKHEILRQNAQAGGGCRDGQVLRISHPHRLFN
jgi:hypothetical protein